MLTQRSLARQALTVSLMTFLSRVSGAARDMLTAYAFSPWVTDAFFLAFRIPNVFRQLLAEGAMNAGFVPVLAQEKSRGTPDHYGAFLRASLGALLAVLIATCLMGIVSAPWIIRLFAPGFSSDPSQLRLASRLLALCFPYLFLIGLCAFFAGILNVEGSFWGPSFSPVAFNATLCSVIFFSMHIRPNWGYSLGLGVLLGGLAQLVFHLIPLKERSRRLRPSWNPAHPALKQMAFLILPTLPSFGMTQINILVDSLFATLLGKGAVSALYYAARLLEFAIGIVPIALATVTLPRFATLIAKNEKKALEAGFQKTLFLTLFLTFPAAVGLFILATPIVRLVYERGNFLPELTHSTSAALVGFSIGLVPYAFIRILVSTFYAFQDTKTPLVWSFVGMLANVLGDYFFLGFGAFGLALATSLSGWIQLIGLSRSLKASRQLDLGLLLSARALKVYLAGVSMLAAWYFLVKGWLLGLSSVAAFSFAVIGVIAFLALTYFSAYFGFGLIGKLRERL
jgi:putative peptidoglycan lipid II flippase